MKIALVFHFILMSLFSFGQRVLLINEKSSFNFVVDSLRIQCGDIVVNKISNNTICEYFVGEADCDSITIYPEDFVPIEILRFKTLMRDTIYISNCSLYKFCSNDTILYQTEKKRIFRSGYKKYSRKTITYCNPDFQTIPKEIEIMINNATYKGILQFSREEWVRVACSKRKSNSKRNTVIKVKYKVYIN